MLFFEHLRSARESLRRTRTRTLLTVTGVAIGIASITTILSLSGGITTIINQQVSNAGDSVALIRPSEKTDSLIELASPTPSNAYSTSPLTEEDVASLQALKGVDVAVPLMTLSGTVRSKEDTPARSSILATTPEFAKTTPLAVEAGQFLDEESQEDMAVIGQQLAIDLFGTNQVVGKRFSIRGQEFTIIGMLKRQNNPINYNNINLDHTAIINFKSGLLFNGGVAQIQQINVRSASAATLSSLEPAIASLLKKNHGNQVDTDILIGDEIAAPSNRLFIVINVVMALIAGISLFVGGIGIMNIMLVSVAERTREIGLRKAVGATSGSIVTQFLLEALIISLLGGLIGYLGGYILAFLVSLFLPYDPLLNWEIAAIALGLAVFVGTLFGLYPAIRASRKNPIESLRRMH